MSADHVALLLPGGSYPVQAPLLAYTRRALDRRGVSVGTVSWTWPPRKPGAELEFADYLVMVRQQVAEALGGGRPLLVAKSLGTLAIPLAAERNLPAVLFTPLLDNGRLAPAIGRADPPPLLVGGTQDRYWDGAAARRLSPFVLEIEGADHDLCLPGPVSASAHALGQVMDAVEDYLDRVVWPPN